MENFEFKRYLPISKVDDEERMVYGLASTPNLDSDGEIITVEAIKNALPNYLQFPTLRVMHQPIVAGTVKSTDVQDNKGLYIGAKVINDEAWKMVKEGGYRGFSIGGNVVNRVGNVINSIDLVEISLVDVPANKQAKIEVWKSGKINKDASTAWELSNIMINLKDTISYFEFLDKDTKSLKSALESIKQALSVEASETEKQGEQRFNSLMDEMYLSENPEDLKKALESLGRIKFDNPVAELLREAVKKNMEEKIIESQEVVEDKTETTEEIKNSDGTVETEVKTEEVKTEETVVEEKTEDLQEQKETYQSITMEKLNKVEDALNKLNGVIEKAEDSKVEFTKSVDGVVEGLVKMTDVLKKLDDRVKALENSPAETKSKASYLIKRESEDKPVVGNNEAITKRLAELELIRQSLGNNEFAKQGFSAEASQLQDKLSK